MGDIRYRIKDDSLMHEYVDKRATVSKRNIKGYANTKPIVGRTPTTPTKYGRYKGNYKSRYYDPVARHERYMRERASLGIGKGRSGSGGGGGSGSGSGRGGSGKSGRGGSGKGKGRNNGANLAATIQALREESQLNTEAQREAARRKIKDLKATLSEHIQNLRTAESKDEQELGVNVTEIRGRIQTIKEQIEKTGGDLNEWIKNEKDALERRIAAVYKKNGINYTVTTQEDKQQASKKRDKEVNSRADAIYKSKSK